MVDGGVPGPLVDVHLCPLPLGRLARDHEWKRHVQTAAAVTVKMRELSADKVGVIRAPGQIGIKVQCQ